MGRFETTASTYAAKREPYPPAFFATVADRLALSGQEALIDVGTGPGLLALGFAPYVGSVVGVEPEPAMAAEARRTAAEAGIAFPVVDGRVEDVAADFGRFDLMTIGRALHWLDREPALAAFARLLEPQGRILICGSSSLRGEANPWHAAYEDVLRGWGEGRGGRHRRLHEHWFDGTGYSQIADIRVAHEQVITPDALVERALTRSTTSPAVIGPRIEEFRAELLATLAPFFPEGAAREALEARAIVFAGTAGRVELDPQG